MKCRLLVVFSVVLWFSFSDIPHAAPADPDRMLAGPTPMFTEWHALQPQLGLFQGRESELPYDFDDLLRLVAPRPCLVVAPRHDRDADPADIDRMIAAVRAAWSVGDARTNLTYETPDDYNRFQGEQQEAFWKWLQPAACPASP